MVKSEPKKKPKIVEPKSVADSTRTDATTAQTSQTENLTSAAETAPLISVGGERVPVMVIYKGKKASRAMVQKLLGRKQGVGGAGGNDQSEAEVMTKPVPVRREASSSRIVMGAVFGTLLVVGLLLIIVGAVLYSNRIEP